ncbi:MAG: cyclic peptide export ABC transporter [Methylococcales bacterium]|nr:cyclic peptide export ABC transporter [Methylococcales bacterium]
MKLFHFLARESEAPKKQILFMAAVSGIANGLLLAIINLAAAQVYNRELSARLFVVYIIALLLFIYTQKIAFVKSINAVEKALHHVKLRITDKIRRVDLRFIEHNPEIGNYTALTQDSTLISQAAMKIVMAAQSLLVLLFSSIYLAMLSPLSFMLTLVMIGVGVFTFFSHYEQTSIELDMAEKKEAEFLNRFTAMQHGFKELQVNRCENDDMFNHLTQSIKDAKRYKVSANTRLFFAAMLGNFVFYLLLLLVVSLFPLFIETTSAEAHKVVATILFIFGPVGMFTGALSMVMKTESAIKNLYGLEEKLDSSIQSQKPQEPEKYQHFNTIRLENLRFHYTDPQGHKLFLSGPHNLTIQRDEMIFIVGGNGSGKSTFLKLLMGLYHSDQGHIYVDDERISPENYPSYQALYSIVLTDFYLFDRVYGLPDVKESEVNDWLKRLQLDKKTHYENQRFTNIDLSTGQKKRLAFIIAVLKNRPICIFDELAADQDPEFRQRFYEEILPDLKAEGRLVIVVSHDDKYFHLADRIIKLEDGHIISSEKH